MAMVALGVLAKSVPIKPPGVPHESAAQWRSFHVASPAMAADPVLSVPEPSPQLTSIRYRLKSEFTGPPCWSGSGCRVTYSATCTPVISASKGMAPRSKTNIDRERE